MWILVLARSKAPIFFPTHISSKAWARILMCFQLQSLVAMPGHTGEIIPACLFLDIPVMVLARDYSTATILHSELGKRACLGTMFLNDTSSKLKWHAVLSSSAKVSKYKPQKDLTVKERVKKRKQEEEVLPPTKRRKITESFPTKEKVEDETGKVEDEQSQV